MIITIILIILFIISGGIVWYNWFEDRIDPKIYYIVGLLAEIYIFCWALVFMAITLGLGFCILKSYIDGFRKN